MQKQNKENRDTTKNRQLFETRIDLPEEARIELVALLNQQLADTFDLYTQAKQAHWNVKGKDFYQLHELFDTLAEAVFPFIDVLAERATALGGLAAGTARMSAANTRLPEFPETVKGIECVRALAERYANAAESTRSAIDTAEELEDMDTSDLFIEISRELDKGLWFLEAHLQAE